MSFDRSDAVGWDLAGHMLPACPPGDLGDLMGSRVAVADRADLAQAARPVPGQIARLSFLTFHHEPLD